MSDVSRSLQSWVSTIQSVVLTADVFQLFIKNSDRWWRSSTQISKLRPSLTINWFWKPKMEVSAPSQAIYFWPGERENRARSSQSPISFFARRIQRRLPFLQEKSLIFLFNCCETSFGYISQFHPKKWPIFRIASEIDFEETTWYREKLKLLSWRNGKRHWMRLAKRLVGLWEERDRFSRFPGSHTPAKVLKPLFSLFRISLL